MSSNDAPLTIHDAHGWAQAERRALLHLVATRQCVAQAARDGVSWVWTETPDGVALFRDGQYAFTIAYAELAAGEAALDAPALRYHAFPCPQCGDEQPMTPGAWFRCGACAYTYRAEEEETP